MSPADARTLVLIRIRVVQLPSLHEHLAPRSARRCDAVLCLENNNNMRPSADRASRCLRGRCTRACIEQREDEDFGAGANPSRASRRWLGTRKAPSSRRLRDVAHRFGTQTSFPPLDANVFGVCLLGTYENIKMTSPTD